MTRRILHIIDSLGRTGLASQALALSRGLAERGDEVHVAVLGGRAEMAPLFRGASVSVTPLRRRWRLDPIALAGLNRCVRRLRPAVIHTWDHDAGLYGRLAARIGRVAVVVVGQYAIERPGNALATTLDRRLANAAARVTNSRVIRQWWGRELNGAEDAIAVIPAGVECSCSGVSREALLEELRLPQESRLIGVIGRLAPEKRVRDLIWAADLLRVLHDNLRLLVIGDGPLQTELRRYARLASDLDHIRFLGERSDVPRILPHLDVLWNASENRRHAIAILEAMAAGVPVVAGDTGLNRELVVENETGFLVPLHERSGRADRARHTDRIFSDGELANRLAAAARQRVAEQFSLDRLVTAYADVYTRALAAKRL